MQTDTSMDLPASQQNPQVNPSDAGVSPSLTATAPGQLKIIKRNGTVVPYTADKISVAMTKAFLAVEGGTAAASPRIRELVQDLTDQMTATFKRRMPSGGTLHIEEIQDQVELALMRSGEQKLHDPTCCIVSSRPKSAVNSRPSTPALCKPCRALMS